MTACGRGLKEDLNSLFAKQILGMPCDISKGKKKASEVVEECLNEGGLED